MNNKYPNRGAWVAQSVERPTSAQVMISRFVSSTSAWGSVLTPRSPEPALDSVSPPLSAPPSLVLSLSLSKISKCRGAWVAQSVKRPTSARSRSRGPGVRAPRQALGVRLWADGSEPGACFRFCVSLSLCPSPTHSLSLSISLSLSLSPLPLSKINQH